MIYKLYMISLQCGAPALSPAPSFRLPRSYALGATSASNRTLSSWQCASPAMAHMVPQDCLVYSYPGVVHSSSAPPPP